MKKIITLILLFCPLFAAADMANSPADKAAALYQSGDFGGALSAYQNVAAAMQNNPYLYYNIGNGFFKLGDYGHAVLYYTKAFRLAPRDAEIRNNLTAALNATGQSLSGEGSPEILFFAPRFFSVNELGILAAACLWISALFCGFWLFLGKKRGFLAVFSCFLVLFMVFTFWKFWLKTSNLNKAVITVPAAELRSGPGTNFPSEALVPAGYTVKITDVKDDWLLVKEAGANAQGWVEKGQLEAI